MFGLGGFAVLVVIGLIVFILSCCFAAARFNRTGD